MEFHPVDFSLEQPGFPVLEGGIDGLAYLPGSIRLKPFRSLNGQDFLDDLRINLLGAVGLLRYYESALKQSGHGSVILFSSVAVQTGMPFHASIAAAKGAVEGLTRSLAAEWAPAFRVNAIAPSLTDTPLAAGLLATEARKAAAIDRHPLRRILEADEPASLAAWLLSEASRSVTGRIFTLDAGIGSVKTN